MNGAKVVIVGEGSPKDMVFEALKNLGGVEQFVKSDDRVFIKPNICGGVPGKRGTFTNTEVLNGLIEALKGRTQRIVVGEADSCLYGADMMVSETGIDEVLEKHGVEFRNLSKEEVEEVDVKDGYFFEKVLLPQVVLESDVVVCVPVMKTHVSTEVTLGMKCMFGILPEQDKARYHPKLDQVIVDLVSVVPPTLTLVDGVTGLEGKGPFHGNPVDLNLIIAGDNVVSVDAVTSMVMGFDPVEILHLKMAEEKGLGEIKPEKINLIGKKVEEVGRTFRRAKQMKIERKLSRISSRFGGFIIHKFYESAVKNWKKLQRKAKEEPG